MKTLVFRAFSFFTLVFFAAIPAVHAADTNPPPRLTVELRDGSRVVGTSGEKNFRFHSALLGEIRLGVGDVRVVECVSSNSAKLTTANGDTLTGWFVDSELAVKTSFGKVELAVGSVRKFTVSAAHSFSSYPPGLVALWSGEGNSKDSAGNNDGELHGGINFAPGKVGQAFAFHGIGDAVTAPTTDLPVGTSDRTFDCWIYLDSYVPGAETFIAGYGDFGVAGKSYAFGLDNSPNRRLIFSQWGEAIRGPALETGRWYNIAVTSVGTSSIKLYVDGVNVASGSLNFDTPPGTQFHIGQVTAPYCIRQCIGLIDEVAVYNRALSAEEIEAIYTAQK
jgi:hypothetical protein